MRAAAITPGKKDSLDVIDVDQPRPGDGEVLVRMLEAGVCGTDEELNSGIIGEAPPGSDYLIIGHENLGVVDEAGRDVRALRRGDLVVATVRRACPGMCFGCRTGQPDMCESDDYFERGIKGMHGYMAEYYIEHPENLIQVPPSLRKIAVLLEPLSIVEKGIEQAIKIQERMIWHPRRALVAGAGPIGLLAALILRDTGLEVSTFATRGMESLKARIAGAAGIDYFNVKETPIEQIVEKQGPLDMIVEATGSSEIAFKSIGLVSNNGIVCLTGLSPQQRTHPVCTDCVNMDLVMHNKAVFGTVSSNRVHFERGLDRLASVERRWPGLLERMFTRRVSLENVKEGLKEDKEDIKILVEIGA
ncbi:glucose 1-dehydrogenase [Methanocella sp. MCL-LM]|uniref:glucose 1-dehydrogenase n=1 Tax=Methanocella sp. MCL-LM TaxID=3412035 RepID=UPI003C72FC4F